MSQAFAALRLQPVLPGWLLAVLAGACALAVGVALWRQAPFEPDVREGLINARGASDNKGQIFAHILGIEQAMKEIGDLPVNLVLLIEGEEELGSAHLESFVAAHAGLLAADFVLSADGAMWRADLPTVTVASRGICTIELTLRGAAKDLHSGRHGGTAPNPLAGLARLVASLHDPDGRVAVAGFYDGVASPSDAVRANLAAIPFDEAAYLTEIGASGPGGENGYTLLERQWLRPTLELNGLWGGYTGPGSKTVIPSQAQAKISCRLVPGQEPARVQHLIEDHLRRCCPPGFSLDVNLPDHRARPYAIPDAHAGLVLSEDMLE